MQNQKKCGIAYLPAKELIDRESKESPSIMQVLAQYAVPVSCNYLCVKNRVNFYYLKDILQRVIVPVQRASSRVGHAS